jgi:hypothetical protein
MKRIIPVIFSLFLLAACNLEEINENPNVPQDVPLSTLLPPAQKGLTDAQGGRIFRYTNIFGQQMEGVDNQELLIENYQPDELFVGNVWSDLYVGSMVNLQLIIERADAEGSPHYAGVARVLMAQALGILTDVWGDVPYDQANQGSAFPNPEYDSQEAIYGDIQGLLDRAINDLSQPESIFSPGSDDLMYNGNLDSWIRSAYVMKARYYLHITKRDPSIYTEALTALQNGYAGAGNDLLYPYLGTGTDINPLSSFFTITPYAEIDPQFIDLLNSLDDPRIDFAFEIIPFTGGRRRPGDFFAAPDAPVRLASYLEQLFLLAEAELRNGNAPGAEVALQEAVELSMNQVSGFEIPQEEIDAYRDLHAILDGSFEENLRRIIIQKYIGMFTSPEPWTDFRRTGYPELEPNPNGSTSANPSGEIPRRLIYPQSERLRNENFPSPAPNMQERFWWDQ